jgi:hypothetical protein
MLSEWEVIKVGTVQKFFSKINVAVVDLTATLRINDRIVIKGPKTDFEQNVDSMQIEYKNIEQAEAGQSIGLKVLEKVREKDVIYKKV